MPIALQESASNRRYFPGGAVALLSDTQTTRQDRQEQTGGTARGRNSLPFLYAVWSHAGAQLAACIASLEEERRSRFADKLAVYFRKFGNFPKCRHTSSCCEGHTTAGSTPFRVAAHQHGISPLCLRPRLWFGVWCPLIPR